MSQLTLESLAERVEKLEQALDRLTQKQPEPVVFKDWQQAVANFPPGDEEFRQAWAESVRELREADRRAAIEEAEREEAGKENQG
jgi:hypothetical protein